MSYDSVILADNPVAYWKLEELVLPPSLPNSFCTDSSGNGHTGSLIPAANGCVAGITGPILTDSPSYGMRGPIARIPGTGGADSFTPFNDFTWEAWGFLTGTGTEMMINHGVVNTPTSYLSFGQRGTGNFADSAYFVLDFGVDGGRDILSCQLPNDVWYHVVAQREGTEMRLYVNSWLVASRSDCPTTPVNMAGQPFRLGYTANGVFVTVDISSGLSHCAVYDYILTSSQIVAHNVAALGSRALNPCGITPDIQVGCPFASAVIGEPYSSNVTVVGGTALYTFSIIAGALPFGMNIDPTTGAVSGTPVFDGVYNFTIQVIDADLATGTSPSCQITVTSTPPPPEAPMTRTFQFDAGTGSQWCILSQLSDSGNELRSKLVKALRTTGRLTASSARVYGFDVGQPIDIAAMEAGERLPNSTRAQEFDDSTEVEQTKRKQINVKNAVLHAIRIEGDDTGQVQRNRVEEIVAEVSDWGVRR